MPKSTIVVPHSLTQDEALQRVQGLLSDVKQNYSSQLPNLQEQWNGNTGQFSFKPMGMSMSGTMDVEPHQVQVNIDFPMAFFAFRGRMEGMVRERLEKALA